MLGEFILDFFMVLSRDVDAAFQYLDFVCKDTSKCDRIRSKWRPGKPSRTWEVLMYQTIIRAQDILDPLNHFRKLENRVIKGIASEKEQKSYSSLIDTAIVSIITSSIHTGRIYYSQETLESVCKLQNVQKKKVNTLIKRTSTTEHLFMENLF